MRIRTLLIGAVTASFALAGCSESAPTAPELAASPTSPDDHLAYMQAEYGVVLLDAAELEALGVELQPESVTADKSGGAISGSSSATYLGMSGGLKQINLSASTTLFQRREAAEYYVSTSYRSVGANKSCSNTPQEFATGYADAYNNGGTVTASQGAAWTGTIKWEVVGNHGALIIGGGGAPFSTSDSYCG